MTAANPVTLPLSQYKARHVRLDVAGKVVVMLVNDPDFEVAAGSSVFFMRNGPNNRSCMAAASGRPSTFSTTRPSSAAKLSSRAR